MSVGCVFNIQKFSIHDGPGIRTTVFLKGCPLNCLWCHNPEGLSRETEIEFEQSKCIMCGACEVVCPNGCHSFENGHSFDRRECVKCGKCVSACIAGGLRTVGKEYTVDEVIEKVLADKIFYETSGGGMTISGGEPFFQPEFTLDLLKAANEKGITSCIETSGFTKTDTILEAVPYTELFLYDYKATGDNLHRELTGVSQDLILKNLEEINKAGASVVLRCPVIPGKNDTDVHFDAIASIAERMSGIIRVDLEPYHPLGTGKAPKIGKTQSFVTNAPESERMNEIRDYISSRTSKKVIVS